MSARDDGPKSEWARYAYGYSDNKPGVFFWVSHGLMVAWIAYYVISRGLS